MDVEFLIVADAAEVVGGKLYLMGGGWEVLYINTGFPVQHPFSIALGLSVPWNETNQRHNVTVEISDEDGNQAGKMSGQLEIGRPAGLPAGQPQLFIIAMSSVLGVKKPGNLVIVARIEDQEAKRVHFRILAGPGVASPPSQAQPAPQ